MQSKVGKIKPYNGTIGTIITAESQYIFLDKDVIDEVEIGDLVVFRDEYSQKEKRARFVKKFRTKVTYNNN